MSNIPVLEQDKATHDAMLATIPHDQSYTGVPPPTVPAGYERQQAGLNRSYQQYTEGYGASSSQQPQHVANQLITKGGKPICQLWNNGGCVEGKCPNGEHHLCNFVYYEQGKAPRLCGAERKRRCAHHLPDGSIVPTPPKADGGKGANPKGNKGRGRGSKGAKK